MKLTQLSDINIRTLGHAFQYVNPPHPPEKSLQISFIPKMSPQNFLIPKKISNLLAQRLQYAISCGNMQ